MTLATTKGFRYLCAVALIVLAAPVWGQLPDPRTDWKSLSADSVRRAAPAERNGRDVELVPIRLLYTFSSTTFFELGNTLKRTRPDLPPEAIMLSSGTYGLGDIELALNDRSVFRRNDDGSFTSFRPIFVSPTATLIIRDESLRLSLPDVAALIYRGDLFVVDSLVTTWDESRGDHGPRPQLTDEQQLSFGVQPARPFLLGLRGSRSFLAGSEFVGLGYNGRSSTYGLALAARDADASGLDAGLRHILLSLPKPMGMLIGNTIRDCFFGFYANNSGATVLLGNVFRGNVIYNIDAQDGTEGLVIARNLVMGAELKHGILVSREVQKSVVAENIIAYNSGTGLMLGRQSADARVSGNVIFGNDADGMAIYESDGAAVRDNLIFSNTRNGIHARNSAGLAVAGNSIDRNGTHGIEFSARELGDPNPESNQNQRPYQPLSAGDVTDNQIRRNLDAALSAKGAADLLIKDNDFSQSAPQVFAGDLKDVAPLIIEGNEGAGYRYSQSPQDGGSR